MSKKVFFIILAVLLRIVLASTSYHSDIQHFDFAGQVLVSGHVLNFYNFTSGNIKYPFNYPPAVYFTVGLFNGVVTGWEDPIFHNNFLFNYSATFGNPEVFLHLLLLKIPYFFFDFGMLMLLMKLFKTPREKNLVFYLWLFNPINLYATYLMGQFDIIPVFFVTLGLYWYEKKEKNWFLFSALFIGIGAAFKIYPVFLIIPLMSVLKSWLERIQVGVIAALAYILPILPFLPSKGFRASALLANQSTKSLYAQIPISGGESIILFLGFLIFFYLLFLRNTSSHSLWNRFFIPLLLFFTFTHYHPQWFLWLTPFFIYDLARNRSENFIALSIALFSFVALIFFFETGLSFDLFSPLTHYQYNLGSTAVIFLKSIDINSARSFFQTLFAGAAAYFIYFYSNTKERNP